MKEGPLNEVKKHNYDTLKFMAEQVKAMVDKLLSMNKFVLLLIPLYVKKREVFDQWQTVLVIPHQGKSTNQKSVSLSHRPVQALFR